MHRAHKIKMQPTKTQEQYFAQACGVARFAFNWALAEWKKEYEAGGKPSEANLRKKLNAVKATEFPWMADVTKCAPQQAIKNVGTAFQNFFRRVKQGGKPGYPKFKRKGVHDSFRADNGPMDASSHAVECVGRSIKLPRCGTVKMRESLRFSGRTLSATVSKQADGWYVTVLVETADVLTGPLDSGTVGVDLGIKNLAALSTGEVLPPLKPHRALHTRLARLSRSLSRKKIGSSNRAKAKTKLARLHKRIADIRIDALHKLTHRLATEFDTIAIEDLNVKGMVRNRHLARSVSDAGFGEFRRQLEYKASMTGASVFVVDRFYPSSKTCSACGQIHEMKRRDRVMTCDCGNVMDRDLNAAINLKNKAVSSTVSACGEDGSGRGRKTTTKPASMKQEDLDTLCLYV
jgi:putative transposase